MFLSFSNQLPLLLFAALAAKMPPPPHRYHHANSPHTLMSKNLAGVAKEILGTAQSVGCTVNGRDPHDIIDKINDGSVEIAED